MSCKFNGKISAEFTPPKTWVLEKALSFTVGTEHGITDDDMDTLQEIGVNIANSGGDRTNRITCKKGMVTDLASVPRVAWNVIAPWDVARAAVIHDHLYAILREYFHSEDMSKSKWKRCRKLADKIFLLGMKAADPKVSRFKMYSAYWSVRSFGRWPASGEPRE
tara:strand:+ start:193 stop:684 length:492 start_codon:yes stop_codon:yes gene_type:complete